MKIQQLKYFVAIYQEGSFSAAATRVNATQSGLSMHVKQIEERYGVSLFERSSSGVRPTESGRLFYQEAIKVLEVASQAELTLKELSGQTSGHVRLGLMPTFTRAVLCPFMLRCAEELPNVRVSIHEAYSAALSKEVVERKLDFAVVPLVDSALGLDTIKMGTDQECFVCSAESDLKIGAKVKLKALPPQRYILPRSINTRRPRIDHYLAANNIDVREIMELDAMLGTLDMVARSDWVAILPGILCLPDLAGNVRRVAPLAGPPLMTDYIRINPKTRPLSSPAQAIANILQEELNNALEINPANAKRAAATYQT